jgi:hypothetical protein
MPCVAQAARKAGNRFEKAEEGEEETMAERPILKNRFQLKQDTDE